MIHEQPQREGNSSALARYLAVSRVAVSKAIKRGRFVESLTYRDGRPWFTDFGVAEREWHANVDRTRAPSGVKDQDAGDDEDDQEDGGPSLSKASAREKHWKALTAELTYKQRAGELVNAAELQAAMADTFTTVRTRLLGVPSKAKQRLPELTLEQLATIDDLVREGLEELVPPDMDAE
jgi:phage terminase Nu1 subunit (DNA packaging protein)